MTAAHDARTAMFEHISASLRRLGADPRIASISRRAINEGARENVDLIAAQEERYFNDPRLAVGLITGRTEWPAELPLIDLIVRCDLKLTDVALPPLLRGSFTAARKALHRLIDAERGGAA